MGIEIDKDSSHMMIMAKFSNILRCMPIMEDFINYGGEIIPHGVKKRPDGSVIPPKGYELCDAALASYCTYGLQGAWVKVQFSEYADSHRHLVYIRKIQDASLQKAVHEDEEI